MNNSEVFFYFSNLVDRIDMRSLFRALRESGFEAPFVWLDYLKSCSTNEDWDEYLVYLSEFAREAFRHKSPSEIIYSDFYECNSEFLSSLKSKRALSLGSVSEIKNGWMKQLVSVESTRLKVCESFDNDSYKIRNKINSDISNRKKYEVNNFKNEIYFMASSFFSEDHFLSDKVKSLMLSYVALSFECDDIGYGFVKRNSGEAECLKLNLNDKYSLCFVPLVSFEDGELASYSISGSLSFLVFAVDNFGDGIGVNLGVSYFLPNGFSEYKWFVDRNDFFINLIAWKYALHEFARLIRRCV